MYVNYKKRLEMNYVPRAPDFNNQMVLRLRVTQNCLRSFIIISYQGIS